MKKTKTYKLIKEIILGVLIVALLGVGILAYSIGLSQFNKQDKTINYPIETCAKNMYIETPKAIFNKKECKKIEQTNCPLVKKLKNDPLKYAINPETQKQVWWKLECKK